MAKNENINDVAMAAKRKRTPFVLIAVIVVVLAVIGAGYFGQKAYKQHNLPPATKAAHETDLMDEALRKNDNTLALAHAKKALINDPHNVDAILAVANIDKAINPTEAKQYYQQALSEFKKQDNPDVSGKSATTYWAAAGLAMQAGETVQAKQYYQDVIKAAKPSDSYDQSIATQAQAALKRLQ